MARHPGSSGRTGAPKWIQVEAQGLLRLHMLEFEAEIGLTFKSAEAIGPGMNRRHSIRDNTADTPKALLDSFPEEIGLMRRLGKAVDRCHMIPLPPYRAYCLAHYNYDGLCGMLLVERESGGFLASWSERETDNRLGPHPVLVHGTEADLQALLLHAMNASRGKG